MPIGFLKITSAARRKSLFRLRFSQSYQSFALWRFDAWGVNQFCTILYSSLFAEPNFVGSFEIGEYVFFFFRETAVEYINCGKSVYSRVARVCKKDTGGKNILSQNWATYLKARLNCSIPGEFPFYFNEIRKLHYSMIFKSERILSFEWLIKSYSMCVSTLF